MKIKLLKIVFGVLAGLILFLQKGYSLNYIYGFKLLQQNHVIKKLSSASRIYHNQNRNDAKSLNRNAVYYKFCALKQINNKYRLKSAYRAIKTTKPNTTLKAVANLLYKSAELPHPDTLADIVPQQENPRKKQSTPQQKAETIKDIFIIVVILVIGIIAVILLINDNRRKKKQIEELKSEIQELQMQKDELVSMESHTKSSENKLRAALEMASDSFIEIDWNKESIHYSNSFFKLTEHSEVQNKDFLNYVQGEDQAHVKNLLEKCRKEKHIALSQFRIVNNNGKSIWVQAKCISMPSQDIYLTLHDISSLKKKETELKRAISELKTQQNALKEARNNAEARSRQLEEENKLLRKKEHTYRTLLNNLPVGVYRLDGANKFLYFNQSLADTFETKDKQYFTDKYFSELFTSKSVYNRWLNNKNYSIEFKTRTYTHKTIWVRITGRYSCYGNKTCYDGLIENITKQKELENNLLKAKKQVSASDRLKSRFLQSISHEIRTPLNAIVGFTRLLENPDLGEEDKMEYLQAISLSNNQLLNILEQVLDLSSIQDGQFKLYYQNVHITQMLKDLENHFKQYLKHLNKADNIRIHYTNPGNKVYFHTDPKALNKIFISLLENAAKFTHEGVISFGCNRITPEYGEFFVSDTGIGISRANRKIIQQAFSKKDYTPGSGGLGIGLTLIRQLAQLLAGELRFESKEGEGTCFFLQLPNTKPASKNS